LLIGVAAAVVLSGCGAAGPVTRPIVGAVPLSPGPGTGRAFNFSVTEKDHAISLRVYQTLEVVLHANPGMTAWSAAKSSDPSVLVSRVDTGMTAVRGVTVAAFQALAPGHAQITAYSGMDCSPGQACAMLLQVLSIDVTVTPAS
jgi:hypothetical protein